MTRKPAVAGYFYPRDEGALRAQIEKLVVAGARREKAVAVVSPHAGYEYSGAVAGAVFSTTVIPDRIILLAPSHRPIRSEFAVIREGTWETPLGEIPVASDLADLLSGRDPLLKTDPEAHEAEHSLEVQLPFIQFQRTDFAMVPILISATAGFDKLAALGEAIAQAVRGCGRDVLLVASTDMSHYVSVEEARTKDFLAIDRILDLDPRGLFDTVGREEISMCGFQPTTAALVAARALGAARAELVMYATSGDRTGNYAEVVGYAGLRIVR